MAKRHEFTFSDDLNDFSTRFFGDESEKFVSCLSKKIRTKIRLNSLKMDPNKTIERIEKLDVKLTPIEFNPIAFEYLPDTFYPGRTLQHHLGHYYLQDLSSMLPALILNPQPSEKVLDMAAAPGSKTTQLAQLMNNSGTLIANDVDFGRLSNLAFNLDRMGIMNTMLTNKDGALFGQLLPEYFDKILLDAPCSALGVLGNKNEVTLWWNYQKVNKMIHIQSQLLVSAIKSLKVGGELVYSTCTLTPHENEWMIDEILKNYPVEIVEFEPPKGLVYRDGVISTFDRTVDETLKFSKRLYPFENDAQGFFLCKLRKTDSTFQKQKDRKHNNSKKPNITQIMKSNDPVFKTIHERFETYFGISKMHFEKNQLVNSGDIWMVSPDFDVSVLDLGFRQGLRFVRPMHSDRYRVTTDIIQLFGQHFTENRIDLETETQMEKFIGGENLTLSSENHGQKAVFYDNQALGSGLGQGTMLKSQIPRAKRMITEEE